MNKTLKFAPDLVPFIFDGSKTSTWRLWDEKNLREGDIVDFIEKGTLKKIGTAILTKVHEKTLGTLSPEDRMGHEEFISPSDLYEYYSKFYSRDVDANTPVKIIYYIFTASN